MYELEEDQDEEIQTLHVYVYEEEQKKPRRPLSPDTRDTMIALTAIAIFILSVIAICLIPTQPPYTIQTIRVSAVYLPVQTYTVRAMIIPTGMKTNPATIAHGTITIFNGSILTQDIPKGFIVSGQDGTEIITDQAVIIPPGNPPAYGTATVAAHTLTSGARANIRAHDINAAYGTSLFLKNLTAFTGGADAQTVTFATNDDSHTALTNARYTLFAQTKHPVGGGILVRPCQEKAEQKDLTLTVSWVCQFVSYTYTPPPGAKVIAAQVQGNIVLLQIKIVARPSVFVGK